MQNRRRGHYELGTEVPANRRVAASFAELRRAICEANPYRSRAPDDRNATAPPNLAGDRR